MNEENNQNEWTEPPLNDDDEFDFVDHYGAE